MELGTGYYARVIRHRVVRNQTCIRNVGNGSIKGMNTATEISYGNRIRLRITAKRLGSEGGAPSEGSAVE